MTDSQNVEASCFWEGQIRVAVQDKSMHFLFENKGTKYNGKGSEMLAALNQHSRPDSVADAITTPQLLFNNSMGASEEIIASRSRFNGMVYNMAHCKIFHPPILIVMFFLRSLHSCYDDLLEQFCSYYKSLESASLDSIVADVRYHDKFKLIGSMKKLPSVKTPKAAAAAASSQEDKQGKEWNKPYKWLASFNIKRYGFL